MKTLLKEPSLNGLSLVLRFCLFVPFDSLSFLFCLFQWRVFGFWFWVARYFLHFVRCSCSSAVEEARNQNRFKIAKIRAGTTSLRRFVGENLFPEDNKTQETSKTCLSYNAYFTITANQLISIVNKRTDTWIYNLCDVSLSESGQFDNLLS